MTDKKVYAAISAVSGELAEKGISKARKQGSQVNYAFRGIDDVYNALAPALVKHKLLILPRCTERSCCERTSKNGGALFYVTVRAEFDFVSTEDGTGLVHDQIDILTQRVNSMEVALSTIEKAIFLLQRQLGFAETLRIPDPEPIEKRMDEHGLD